MKSQKEFKITDDHIRMSKAELDIESLSLEIKRLSSVVEIYRMKQEKSIKLIYTWIAFSIFLIVSSIIMTQINAPILKFMEIFSSWGACIFLVIGGIYSAKVAYSVDKMAGYIVSASWAIISTCYIGYVLFNFGAFHPYAGAIGFNIGASAQTVALIVVSRTLKKNG